MRTAIGEEDDPPQNPCEPWLSVYVPGLFKRVTAPDFVSSLFFASKSSGATIRLIRNYPYIIRQCPALTQPGRVRGCSMVCRYRQLRGYRDVPGPNPGGGIYCIKCPGSVAAYHDCLSRNRLGFEFRPGRRFSVFVISIKIYVVSYA